MCIPRVVVAAAANSVLELSRDKKQPVVVLFLFSSPSGIASTDSAIQQQYCRRLPPIISSLAAPLPPPSETHM